MFQGENILVTGGTGMIGSALTRLLLQEDANIFQTSLDDPSELGEKVNFTRADLRHLSECVKVCEDMDCVFHLAGITGSPRTSQVHPGTFMSRNLMMNTNMLEAARLCEVKKYLFASTCGIYAQSEVMEEDSVWKSFPSDADKYGGWAKRMGELQIESYRIEYGWDDLYIVRPANVYGPGANFNPNNSMVVASLIRRAMEGENPLIVWGDGTAVRDFIHCEDVARGMLLCVEKNVREPINLGSGEGVMIRDLVEIIIENIPDTTEIQWDMSKPSGDSRRILDTRRAKSYGISCNISLAEGIKGTIDWYRKNKNSISGKYNAFAENK